MKSNKQSISRLVGLDLFRVIAVLTVFLFHSHIHVTKCDYGFLNDYVNMGAIYMTGFFILSGFVLFHTYKNISLTSIVDIKKYYLKRLIVILPLYFLTAIFYILFLGKETWSQDLLLFPIETLGIQSVFNSLFNISHNGGTWFVSCILICYLLYPFIQEIMKQLKRKDKIIILCVCIFILLYSPFIVRGFKISNIYSNPFFRCLEFFIGILLCSLKEDEKCFSSKLWGNPILVLLEFAVLIAGVTLGVRSGKGVGDYMLYNLIALPMFSLITISMSSMNKVPLGDTKIFSYLVKISYAFFLAQYFVWPLVMEFNGLVNNTNNILTIMICFILCLAISILGHELFEKPIQSLMRKKLLKA